MIITIDGPAGSGKSAAALLLAGRLHVPFLDTGAMYRAVALDALENGLLAAPASMEARARALDLNFDWTLSPPPILLNGRNVSEQIRLPRVTEIIYLAADNPAIRAELVRRQRALGQQLGSLVTEGRDQGSIVFPQADFKFYLDATPRERARRRIAQMTAKGIVFNPDEVLAAIELRDRRDRSRNVGPLLRPADSILLDTTAMTLEEVVTAMQQRIAKCERPPRG